MDWPHEEAHSHYLQVKQQQGQESGKLFNLVQLKRSFPAQALRLPLKNDR